MQKLFLSTAILVAVVSSACNPLEFSRPGYCIMSEDDNLEMESYEGGGSFENVRLLSFEEETIPPQRFQNCAQGKGVEVQLEREDGVVVFLAIEVDSSLGRLSQGVSERFDGADIAYRFVGGFVPSSSLSIVDEDGPIVLLEQGGRFNLSSAPGLSIQAGDNVGPPKGSGCTRGRELEVVFETDSATETVRPQESVELVINGFEGHGHNLGTYDLAQTGCTDSPSGIYANWAFTDASF